MDYFFAFLRALLAIAALIAIAFNYNYQEICNKDSFTQVFQTLVYGLFCSAIAWIILFYKG